jgi:HAD superfamily hydrolase (TIGR01450 family)
VIPICCDLDGVLWRGEAEIPGSSAAIDALRDAGHRVVFVTNNSSLTVDEYLAKLRRVGVDAVSDDLLTSAKAAAHLLASQLAARSRVLACAGPGVREALAGKGFVVVDDLPADAVVVGWHRTFDFAGMTIAADAVRAGARFVATNLDPTYPDESGVVPGAGAIVAAVATAGGRSPDAVAGKPEAAMAALVLDRVGRIETGVMIGDRASTDGAFATRLGWPFAFVQSGIAGDDSPTPPAYVAADLAALVPQLLG